MRGQVGRGDVAQQGAVRVHVDGGLHPVPHHVPDHQQRPAEGQPYRLEPVAADHRRGAAGQVARGQLQVRVRAARLGQQRPLQLHGEVLREGEPPGVVDAGGRPVGDGLDHRGVVGEGRGAGAAQQRQHPDQLPPRAQRHHQQRHRPTRAVGRSPVGRSPVGRRTVGRAAGLAAVDLAGPVRTGRVRFLDGLTGLQAARGGAAAPVAYPVAGQRDPVGPAAQPGQRLQRGAPHPERPGAQGLARLHRLRRQDLHRGQVGEPGDDEPRQLRAGALQVEGAADALRHLVEQRQPRPVGQQLAQGGRARDRTPGDRVIGSRSGADVLEPH